MENLPLMDSIALSCVVFDEKSFGPVFKKYVSRALFSVIIMAPYITAAGLFRLLDVFDRLVRDGVQVCIYLRPPDEFYLPYESLDTEQKETVDNFNRNLKRLINAGVHVTLSDKIHQKVAVIDGRYLWDGSLNILSYNPKKNEERMTCIDSPYMALCAIGKHGLLNCPHCHTRRLEKKGVRYTLLSNENFGAMMREKRTARGLKQDELAHVSGVSRKVVSEIEGSNFAFKQIDTMMAILDALDEELITVPRDCLPLIESLLWSMKPEKLINLPKPADAKSKFVRRFAPRRKAADASAAQFGKKPPEETTDDLDDFSVPPETSSDVPR